MITDTYGVKLDDLMQKWGLAPNNRANKVRLRPSIDSTIEMHGIIAMHADALTIAKGLR